MLDTTRGARGMVTSPHYLASEAGLEILKMGGTAAEAAVATAATLAVVYPHMNSIGGDSFWLLAEPGDAPVGVDACGRAGAGVTPELYGEAGLSAPPRRGPLAANTVAGAVSGWAQALAIAGSGLSLDDILASAIRHAEDGVVVGDGLGRTLAAVADELRGQFGFAQHFLPSGAPIAPGDVLRQPALAHTLRRLASEGLDSFYRGALSVDIAKDLAAAGAPITAADLVGHRADVVSPLSLRVGAARVFNLPPPTQGVASLLILGLFDRLACDVADSFAHVHGVVEATKLAFAIRNAHVGDPVANAGFDAAALLSDDGALDALASRIDPEKAAPWPLPARLGDTVWFGVVDGEGRSVSAIQSTYFEFGSGVVLPRTGITWQNRGCGFDLRHGPNALAPGAKPFHTLNPAMALFDDGRTMIYGSMGGDGQPQTQAAIFTRYARFGAGLQAAVSAPRWLLGRTWGDETTNLKLEGRFAPSVVEALEAAGHSVAVVEPFASLMGHAAAIVRHRDGALEGAFDPRSDGGVATY